MREELAGLKKMNLLEAGVTITSSMQDQDLAGLGALADAIAADFKAE